MRRRPSSRLIVLNSNGEVLLFRFMHKNGALAGKEYWATPGGGLEEGETFEQAATRELKEETGIDIETVGIELGRREFILELPDGEKVLANERYFLIHASTSFLSRDGWTGLEKEVMAEHKWWSKQEIELTNETIWPENIVDMLNVIKTGG